MLADTSTFFFGGGVNAGSFTRKTGGTKCNQITAIMEAIAATISDVPIGTTINENRTKHVNASFRSKATPLSLPVTRIVWHGLHLKY